LNAPTPGRLLVVTANLKKALPRYLGDDLSLVNFARRIARVVPYAPDALLLQEVVALSARRAAELVGEATGADYMVAVQAGESATVGSRAGQDVVRNCAIILNSRTLRLDGRGDFAATRYALTDARAGVRARIKEHPRCLARSVAQNLSVALASVHLVTNDKLTTAALGYRYKGRWAAELAEAMASRYGRASEPRAIVIGGDFNNRRCRGPVERVDCRPLPFWDALCRDHGYTDAVFARHGSSTAALREQSRKGRHVTRRIDYLFVRGRVFDASHDTTYDARTGDPHFYSDHRLVWGLVGPP
jgi:endonuclease/exonuclease/phosphatase family metal-dependent hydrolase